MSDRPLPRRGEPARAVCRRTWRALFWVVVPFMIVRLILDLALDVRTDVWLAQGWRPWVLGPLVLTPYVLLLAAAATWAAALLVVAVRPATADEAR
ncbi:hypothetical protein [Aeromicrobium sp. IC_218]|uniref:hypothetical protein n=1 Tax=Aeromicrobium sp. IC_218 TaxID=2545468 RepID=UPI0010391AAA|nr:hypothetical protein [Aeromicrobium sp. IC_218]TCI99106.1 hypothetical protein E0W78_07845 [Aeromicrobium sp. IC_218]